MFQAETYDKELNQKELSWAKDLGFNSVRVYLHDLLWNESDMFKNLNDFLDICNGLEIRPILVLFGRLSPTLSKIRKQPKPVRGFITLAGNKALVWLSSMRFMKIKNMMKFQDCKNLLKKFFMISVTMNAFSCGIFTTNLVNLA